MSTEIRMGVAGLTHGHVGGLIHSAQQVEGVKLVAVADATPLMESHGGKFERQCTDWLEMLDKENLDALIVTSNNVESSAIAVEALGRGIPCLVEKAMAANYNDAKKMLGAMESSGQTLMINWPLAWWPSLHELKRQLDAESIGKVFHLRYRNGHHGPKEIGCDQWFVEWLYNEKLSGGGAIADFCCYGAVLCRWLFGMPESVWCVRKNYTKDYVISDDHAVCVLKYPTMSAILEGTWATFGFDESANPVIHGKLGTLGAFGNQVRRYAAGKDTVVVDSPAMAVSNPVAVFLECSKTGTAAQGILNPYLAADACKILDAALKSARTGCAEMP